jgi:hypothetical protein
MATTLSYGFVKPQNGDKGSTFFPALADNVQKTNDHTHNGTDSAKLSGPVSANVATQSVPSGSWADQGNGTYRQLVTLSSLQYDNINISFKTSAGHQVYPTVEKVSATTYYVYTNDNTLTYTAVYSS